MNKNENSYDYDLFVEIIKQIAIESEISIKGSMKVLSFYYNIPFKKLRSNIIKLKPEWFGNDAIYGFIDGKPIKRSILNLKYQKIRKKIDTRIKKLFNNLSYDEIGKIVNIILMKYQANIYKLFREDQI